MKLRVGVVGLRRGRIYVEVFKLLPETEVTAVCDLDRSLAENTAQEFKVPAYFTDYRDMLDHGADVAVVCTPAPLHATQSIEAMKRGIHVLSEVPAAYTLEECSQLAEIVEKTGVKYMMAENYIFLPYMETISRVVNSGLIGKPIYVEGEYVHDCRYLMKDDKGRLTWRARLPPIQYCTHNLGPILRILGDKCRIAVGMHTGCNVAPELKAIDLEVGLFKTVKGVVVRVLNGFSVAREPMLVWFAVYGTKGVVEGRRCGWDGFKLYVEGLGMGDMARIHPSTRYGAPEIPGGHGSSEYILARGFVRSIIEDFKPPIDIYEALDYTAPGICAHLSAEMSGRPVEVPDFRKT